MYLVFRAKAITRALRKNPERKNLERKNPERRNPKCKNPEEKKSRM